MSRIEEVAVLNRDNDIVFELSVFNPLDPSPAPIVPIRCQVLAGTTLLDSAVTPSLFDLTVANLLTLKFRQSGLSAGRYPAKLYLFFENKPNGVLWDEFVLNVR